MVYVGTKGSKYRGMIMYHMVSQDLNKLHEMAEKLGLRKYFQNEPGKRPHYDVCKKNKKKAIELGAIEINDQEIVKLIKRNKN